VNRPLISGNWKMNTSRAEAVALAEGVAAGADKYEEVDFMICPPHVYLQAVSEVVSGTRVALGAQNVYHEPKGAFTGEVSAGMLKDVGCDAVIVGHSERRHIFGETDDEVNKKVHSALQMGLLPIVCVGELLEEREAGQTISVIRRQCDGSLSGVGAEQMRNLVLAYEPVWAIGTGEVATPEQVEEVHSDLRSMLADHYNDEIAQNLRILYGGSVKPDNAGDLLSRPNVNGALVGGASLDAQSFLAIGAATPQG